MLFRRRRITGQQWLGVARVGSTTTAVCVSYPPQAKPVVAWQWVEAVNQLPQMLQSLHKARGSKLPPSSLVLDRGQYTLVSTVAPDVPREEWADALRWQLRDQIEHAIDEAIIDVLAVPEESQTRATRACIVLITPDVQGRQIYLESDDEGHDWSVVEAPETVLRNICALGEVDDKAHALMVFGEQYGMLVITYKGELLMTRTIEVAVSAIAGAVEARAAALGRAGLEVLRTLDTFERMHSKVNLSALSVALPAGAEGMIEVLGDLVYLPIQQLSLADYLDLSALGEEQAQVMSTTPSFGQLCALGAALRFRGTQKGLQQISLLTPAAHHEATPWSIDMGAKLAAATAALAVVAGVALNVAGVAQSRQADQAEQALLAAGGQSPTGAPKPAAMVEMEGLRATEGKQRAMRDGLARMMATADGHYSDYLQALSRQTPGNLWITGLVVYPNGHDVELRGRMVNPVGLPDYLARLEQEPQFKGRRFAQLEMKALGLETNPDLAGITEFALKAKVSAEPKLGAEGGQP